MNLSIEKRTVFAVMPVNHLSAVAQLPAKCMCTHPTLQVQRGVEVPKAVQGSSSTIRTCL